MAREREEDGIFDLFSAFFEKSRFSRELFVKLAWDHVCQIVSLFIFGHVRILIRSIWDIVDKNIKPVDNIYEQLRAYYDYQLERFREMALKVALARLYLAEGSPSRVLAMLHEMGGTETNTASLLQLQGDAQFALGEYAAAAEDYTLALEDDAEDATLYYVMSQARAPLHEKVGGPWRELVGCALCLCKAS